MKNLSVAATVLILIVLLVTSAQARRGRASDRGIPIVSKYVCSDLCRGNESIYIYEGVTDPDQCAKIGGQMYSHQGWETIVVCKVMNKKRCREYDGRIGEFHFPFESKNYTHLGCTADMKPEQCRKLLREAYATKSDPNKYFMNNIGCLAH
jgi:hypothetical protein